MNLYDGITVEIDNSQDVIEITNSTEDLIIACVQRTLDMEEFEFNTMVSIILVDNATIEQMNSQFRGIAMATDVLSFPMLEIQAGCDDLDEEKLINDIHPETGSVILGDIVISMEKVRDQALEYGHSFERELGFLVVHGMLHLLGYDHIEEEDMNIMRPKEEAILESLNLTRT
ncbi:MAG: rRNA maturation RNase YbeY [Caldicoprobacterales bacterium]|jgi:probable rRNA maturation factor|nr:rRNA maturation RNase YbeY [Clostridiales bacterium]